MEVKQETHRCVVAMLPRSRWHVECPTCGEVGQPQDLKGDADAIAARHEEIGGFEARH